MQETVSLARNKPIKILTVFGTRPEAIKMAPVVKALKEDKRFSHFLGVTGQHREMLDQVLELFNLKADLDLNIMEERQTLTQITIKALRGLDRAIEKIQPHLVLVHGDTTTTFAGALSAFYHRVRVAHVEAGLRSYDILNPYPEEMNRRLTDELSEIFFAPTAQAGKNLEREGFPKEKIFVTGNTVVDALLSLEPYLDKIPLPYPLSPNRPFILVEVHRRENWGDPLRDISLGLKDLAQEFPHLDIAVSLHKNPVVRENVLPILGGVPNVHVFEPFSYLEFLSLMKKSLFIVSDSGGIQEEAPSFHRPVLVTRRVTERPEGVKAGVLEIVGVEREKVRNSCRNLVLNPDRIEQIGKSPNPFGDGKAASRIRDYLLHFFGFLQVPPQSFNLPLRQTRKKGYREN